MYIYIYILLVKDCTKRLKLELLQREHYNALYISMRDAITMTRVAKLAKRDLRKLYIVGKLCPLYKNKAHKNTTNKLESSKR